jgi:hypothetical protein
VPKYAQMQEVLPPEERRRLDELSARTLVEYLAERLGQVIGHARLEFVLTNGSLRSSWLHEGPLRDAELDARAGREAPPLPPPLIG